MQHTIVYHYETIENLHERSNIYFLHLFIYEESIDLIKNFIQESLQHLNIKKTY